MLLRAFLISALAANPLPNPEGPIFSSPALTGRTAFFEFAPANGRGMTGECATSNPTGVKGEALSFTRATSATCTKGTNGLRTTGILTGQLVSLGSGIARQMYNANGVLGLLVEAAGTNLVLRYIALDNAAYADVGTPTLTTGQTDPKGGTTAVLLEDNDAAAYEGREQVLTVSAGVAHTMHCYVMAGTLDKARISIDGTTQDISGLLQTEWHIITRTDASSSGTSITVQVLNGNTTTDTGTIVWGGCDVKVGSYRTSIIETAGATGTRNAEVASFAPTWPSSTSISMANDFTGPTPVASSAATTLEFSGFTSALNEASGGSWRWYTGAVPQVVAITSSAAGIRTYGWHNGSTRGMAWAANTAGPTADVNAANKFATTLYVGGNSGNRPDGIISRVCVDPDATRCR